MGFFKDLFNDNNTINEKSVVGFASFVCMVLALVVDLVTGYLGKELLINEFIFDGFFKPATPTRSNCTTRAR